MSRETTLTIGTRVHRLAMTDQRGPRGPVGPQGNPGPTGAPGAVQSVASIAPDVAGNVPLTPADIGALPKAGGTLTGPMEVDISAGAANAVAARVKTSQANNQRIAEWVSETGVTRFSAEIQTSGYEYVIFNLISPQGRLQLNGNAFSFSGRPQDDGNPNASVVKITNGAKVRIDPLNGGVAINAYGAYATSSVQQTWFSLFRGSVFAWNGTVGWAISSSYSIDVVQASLDAGDAVIEFRGASSAAQINLSTGTLRTRGNITPITDISASCGEPSRRWTQVHAQDGTIQTSDARLKSAVEPLSPALIAIGLQCARETGRYKWLARIAEVGDAARWHIGLHAQRVVEIFAAHGEDAYAYGIVCHDEWPERTEIVTPAEYEQRDTGTLDEHGMPVYETVETTPAVTRTIPAGDAYSLRYDELSRLIAAAMIAQQDALEARVTALEGGA